MQPLKRSKPGDSTVITESLSFGRVLSQVYTCKRVQAASNTQQEPTGRHTIQKPLFMETPDEQPHAANNTEEQVPLEVQELADIRKHQAVCPDSFFAKRFKLD